MLIAANRDEMLDRLSLPPARHWPDQPNVIGGLDALAGGTWLAVNRAGVAAAVLNRLGTLGPVAGKRSRGELPLMALQHDTAQSACDAMIQHDSGDWRSFNLVIADRNGAYFLRGLGHGPVTAKPASNGVHVVTAREPDDRSSPRVSRNLPRFKKSASPCPPDWSAWQTLLSDDEPPSDAAINIVPFSGFGTVSSALVGLGPKRTFLATNGPPGKNPFFPVEFLQTGIGKQAQIHGCRMPLTRG